MYSLLLLLQYFYYVIIGVVSGTSMGIIGVGSGLLTIPALVFTGLSLQQSVGISLIIQLLPQSLPGAYMYYKKGHVNKKILIITAIVLFGSFIGTTLGSYLVTSDYLSQQLTYRILTVLLFISSLYIGFNHWNINYKDTGIVVSENSIKFD